jgi:hypothetical protein
MTAAWRRIRSQKRGGELFVEGEQEPPTTMTQKPPNRAASCGDVRARRNSSAFGGSLDRQALVRMPNTKSVASVCGHSPFVPSRSSQSFIRSNAELGEAEGKVTATTIHVRQDTYTQPPES